MEHRSPRFYDIRFGLLVGIIISILLFRYFNAQPAQTAPAVHVPAASAAPPSHTDTAGIRVR